MAKGNKRFMVVPRTGNAKVNGLDTGLGHRSFRRHGAMFVSDPAEAHEIDHKYGLKGSGEVWVHEDPMYEWHLKNDGSDSTGRNHDVHRYTFGSSKWNKLTLKEWIYKLKYRPQKWFVGIDKGSLTFLGMKFTMRNTGL